MSAAGGAAAAGRHWRTRAGRRAGDRLSRRRARLDVQPHPRGPWLVSAGRRRLAVPPAVGRALLPLHGLPLHALERVVAASGATGGADPLADVAIVAAWLAGDGARDGRRAWWRAPGPLLLRAPVLPAFFVRAAARRLRPLASWPALASMAALGLAALLAARPWARPCPLTPAVVALFAAGALWHELGHAAALAREGYQPGRVGVGLFVCVPVLYADVSPATLLPRAGRLRVDLAGMAFQAGAAGLFAALAAVAPAVAPGVTALAAACRAAALATVASLAYGLLPLPRTDGGWLMRDALDAAASPGPVAARLRRAVAGLGHLTTGLACLLLPAHAAAWVARAARRAGRPQPPGLTAALAGALTVAALAVWLRRLLLSSREQARARGRGGGARRDADVAPLEP